MELSILTIAVSTIFTTHVFLCLLLLRTQDEREPPMVAATIPFISPLIGLSKKNAFYIGIRDKFHLPIVTLRLPFSRIYIINSTNLIPITQRQHKILSFKPVESLGVIKLVAASKEADEILKEERDGVAFAYMAAFDKAMHPALSPGPGLDAVNRDAVNILNSSLAKIGSGGSQPIKMFDWIKGEISWATTEAVFGPQNPYRDPKMLEDFWAFDKGFIVLILQIFPRLFARKAIQARERLVVAMERYIRNGGHEQGSALIKARVHHSLNWNIPINDIARFEIGGSFAILPNSVFSSFWLVWHIFSDARVLREIREELGRHVTVGPEGNTIDMSDVKANCPILLSTFQEVLRYRSSGTSVRIALEDHLLAGQYLIKRGSTIMIPSAVQHSEKDVWGSTVLEFDHTRFIRSPGKQRFNPVAFRGFGGGTTLCPGRHFASTEILAFAALVTLQFDVEPVSGSWVQPTTKKAGSHVAIPGPDEDIDIRLSRRGEEKKWRVLLSGSEKGLDLVAEDMAEK